MSLDRAKAHLEQFGLAGRIQLFDVSSATVELAAQAVGCAPARIAKTLSFKVGERPILVVAAGDARIDNSKYKHFFGVKARMLTPEEAVEHIGHAVGGVCPFGIDTPAVTAYLDVSLRRFDTVYPAAGNAASAVRLIHKPTGVVVSSQQERSQFQNKDNCMKQLRAKLIELKIQQHAEKISDIKGVQMKIEWGSQIRSYVFMPYQLVKDTRTGYETSQIDNVMDGDLDGFLNAYLTQLATGELKK